MTKRLSALALAGVLTALAAPAFAQNAALTANYGERSLSAGFTPSPHSVQVVAGGSTNAKSLGGDCVGMISSAPDFQLTYSAGGAPLVFRTQSDADTTLVISPPGGGWRCDDDGYGDGNANVIFNTPESGVYDVWVGTYGENPAPAQLMITETP